MIWNVNILRNIKGFFICILHKISYIYKHTKEKYMHSINDACRLNYLTMRKIRLLFKIIQYTNIN